jgi:hypothetical protein
VDTLSLYALTGTPLSLPSAYSLPGRGPIRTDESIQFDFAFEMLPDDRPVFLPLLALRLDASVLDPGFIPQQTTFDAITEAPLNGYLVTDTLPATPGALYIVRSRMICTATSSAFYAKLEVLAQDPAARSVTFRILVDRNCGYRGLEPGIPNR